MRKNIENKKLTKAEMMQEIKKAFDLFDEEKINAFYLLLKLFDSKK